MSFQEVEQDDSRDPSVSLLTCIVMKLMQQLFKRGYSVACGAAIRKPEQQVCKVSHCGSKQQ